MNIPVDGTKLEGEVRFPDGATGLVVFAHGSGSSRHSPRNNYAAEVLREHGLGTLLFDLLTEEEDRSRENRFDIPRLTDRMIAVTEWLDNRTETSTVSIGYFGSSTGAAAALRAAAQLGTDIRAVVSRGGRVDMASEMLDAVEAATLFIVGGADTQVLQRNREAFEDLTCKKELTVIDGAGHLFDGPGELEEVAEITANWFVNNF